MSADHTRPGTDELERIETDLLERERSLSLITEISHSMLSEHTSDAIARVAVDALHQHFPRFRTAYSTVASDGTVTIVHTAGPEKAPAPEGEAKQIGVARPAGWARAVRSDGPDLLVVSDVDADVISDALRAELAATGTRAFLDAPLRHPDDRTGALSLDSPTPHEWTRQEQATLRTIADFLLVAVRGADQRQQLRESEERFRVVADQSDVNITLVQGSRIIYANRAMRRMTGYSSEELQHMDQSELVHPDSRELAENRTTARFEGDPQIDPLELRILTKDGSERWIEFRGSTVVLDGEPTLLTSGVDVTLRKRAEKSARESESRLRSVLEGAFDGMAVVVDGKAVYVNSALAEMFKYETDELVGVDPSFSLVPDDRDRARQRMRAIQANVGPPTHYGTEYTGLCKDGTTFPLEVLSRPIRYDGAPALLATLRDVTQRKLQEQAVREAEIKYRSLVEKSLAGVYVVQDRHFAYVNPKVAEIFGYTQAELLRMPSFLALATDDARPALAAKIEQGTEGETETVPYDFQAVRKDGRIIDVEVHGGPTTYLGRPAIIGTCLDVTARETADKVLRRSEERFRTLFEQAPIGIAMAAPDMTLLRVNAAFCELLGYDESELVGKPLVELTDQDDAGGTQESAMPMLRDAPSATRLEKRYRHKDGTLIQAEMTVSVARSGSTDLQYAVVMIQDVTDRHRLEDRIQEMQRLESVGQLAGGVAHNFNNALTAIYGYSELLARRFEVTDPARRDLEQIQRVAEQSASLTRQLLAFSRKEQVRPSVFCLNDAVETTRDLLSPLIGDHIRIRLHLDRALRDVNCDRAQIEQIITNLVLNARDALPDGGALTITTENVTVDDAVSRTNPEAVPGPYVRLTVTDTGTGIDEASIGRVFEPFYTTKEQGEGVGLGLAMVHGAVKQSGGFVTVQSVVEVGSTFALYFPEVKAADAKPKETDTHGGIVRRAESSPHRTQSVGAPRQPDSAVKDPGPA